MKAFSDRVSTGRGASGTSSRGAYSKQISTGAGSQLREKPKSFSDDIETGPKIDFHSDGLIKFGEFKYTDLQHVSPWWQHAFGLLKKGYSWEDITAACNYSYLGPESQRSLRGQAAQALGWKTTEKLLGSKEILHQEILQEGWPELHGKLGEPFVFAGMKIEPVEEKKPARKKLREVIRAERARKEILPAAPEADSEWNPSAFLSATKRIKNQLSGITDGDIAAALEIYWNESGGSGLSPEQKNILQTGWPHVLGPPGRNIPVKRYWNPVARGSVQDLYPKKMCPEYSVLQRLRDEYNFFSKTFVERKAILKDLGIDFAGYYYSLTRQEKELIKKQLGAMGIKDAVINRVSALFSRAPDPGYTRHRDPTAFPSQSLERKLISWFGFVDLDENGNVHDAFPLLYSDSPRIPRGSNYHPKVGWY